MAKYTAIEAAEILGVNPSRVRQLCRDGRMGKKHGRDWIITLTDVTRYDRERRRKKP